MTDGQTKGSVFTDESVDTRAPTASPAAPASNTDVIGANFTLGYQDMAGQPLQAKIDAYLPIVSELDRRDTRSWTEKIFGPQYLTGVTAGLPVNTTKVWDDIARIRASDPTFLKDIPAKNDDEFDTWVRSGETAKRRQAQDVVRRESGFGQQALGFATGIGTSLVDPINLGGMALTGPLAGGGKSLLGAMARDAVTNMAIETAELPSMSQNRAQFGETMTATDMLTDVGMAGIGGAAFPIATHGLGAGGRALGAGGRAVGDAIADSGVARSAQRYFAPWALGRANLDQVGDAEVARMFSDSVPFEARTPEAQAGLYVLNRESEVRDASPYVATPGGLDANAEKLTATNDALSRPATLGNTPAPARPRGRITSPISQNSIIGFVMNDLEGGAKVVHYNDADGGVTKFGIAQKFNPGVDVANLTEAEAGAIARRRYWLPEFNNADPRVAAVAFDAGFINSPSLARRIIREAGDDLDKAVSIYRDALNRIADRNPGKEKYRKGWMNRVDKLARFVGDADASSVRLAPEGFGDDEAAYRAAQDQLNGEELGLAADTPRSADPVRDAVDRLNAGDGKGDGPDDVALRSFVDGNQDAVAAEMARRDATGAEWQPEDGQPRAAAPVDAPIGEQLDQLSQRVAGIERAGGSIQLARLADQLGVAQDTAQRALRLAAEADPVRFRVAKSTGAVSRRPSRLAPKDVLHVIAEAGGIADDEGHGLRQRAGPEISVKVKGKRVRQGKHTGRDWGNVFVPGVGKLVSTTRGRSVDDIGELLTSEGFFQERPTTADVLDTIERAVFGEKIYPLHETSDVLARGEKLQGRIEDEAATEHAWQALAERIDRDDIDDGLVQDVAHLTAHGAEPGDAVSLAIEWRWRQFADTLHEETGNPDYDWRAALENDRPRESGDAGVNRRGVEGSVDRSPDAGGSGQAEPHGEPASFADLDRWADDERAAQGLDGPPPLDPANHGVAEVGDATAMSIGDSIVHDVRAALDSGALTDPAIAERHRQMAKLQAEATLRAGGDQESEIGLALFDAVDQGRFQLDEHSEPVSAQDVLDAIARDEAAVKAAKDCL